MAQMRPPHRPAATPRAVFDAARSFGLTPDEIWEEVGAVLQRTDHDTTLTECLDDVTVALTRRILAKERRAAAERRRVGGEHRL